METERTEQVEVAGERRAYETPRLTRYQRLQDMTRGDSPTGQGTPETCSVAAHCESNPIT